MPRDTLDTATGWLVNAGLRPTRQRLALAELLVGDGRHRHVTAESLFEAARDSGVAVSLATVYNTLRAFCAAGVLQEITVDGSKSYFDTNTSDHHHFFVEGENRIIDIPDGPVQVGRLPEPPEGMEIAHVDVIVRLKPRKA